MRRDIPSQQKKNNGKSALDDIVGDFGKIIEWLKRITQVVHCSVLHDFVFNVLQHSTLHQVNSLWPNTPVTS